MISGAFQQLGLALLLGLLVGMQRERAESQLGGFRTFPLVTLLGMMLPSTTRAFSAARWSHARQHWRGVQAFKAGLAPVTISLLFATGWILTGTRTSGGLVAITLAAVLLVWRTRIHLLWLIGGGAVLGALGLV